MEINELLTLLYQKHYQAPSASTSVTSSHWGIYNKNEVVRTEQGFIVKPAIGFGDFTQKTLFEALKFIIPDFLLKRYMRENLKHQEILDAAKQTAQLNGRLFSFDCAKQVVVLQNILGGLSEPTFPQPFSKIGIKKICIIGDGYGYLGSLIKALDSDVQIIFVNLGKQLLYDAYFTAKIFSANWSYDLLRDNIPIAEFTDFQFIEAENYHVLESLDVDLYINIASMQEMSLEVVENYFKYMRAGRKSNQKKLFYCCNRVEKTLPGGEVLRFDEYPWHDSEIIFESSPLQWYSHFPSSRPPFWKPFDGEMKERLVYL